MVRKGFEGVEKNIAMHNVKLIPRGRRRMKNVTLHIKSPLCSGVATKRTIVSAVRKWTKAMQAGGGLVVVKVRCSGTAAPTPLKLLENTQQMGQRTEGQME